MWTGFGSRPAGERRDVAAKIDDIHVGSADRAFDRRFAKHVGHGIGNGERKHYGQNSTTRRTLDFDVAFVYIGVCIEAPASEPGSDKWRSAEQQSSLSPGLCS